jgi:hypothetical protein
VCKAESDCIVTTAWDVARFADRVKSTVASENGTVSQTDGRLHVYFEQASFGDIHEPTTIIDKYGRVMLWHLPGCLHPMRLVSLEWTSQFSPIHPMNRSITITQHLPSLML